MSKIRKFIDIGANLTDAMYSGVYNNSQKHVPDLGQVLNRSWHAGLEKIIITSGNLTDSKKAIEIAQTDDRLFATVGCHPTRCQEFVANPIDYLNQLRDLISNHQSGGKVVAVGECGLDYDRVQFCPPQIQIEYFELQLSGLPQLPLFLHCRNAADDLYGILRKYPDRVGVVHSYDGTIADALRFISLGYYIGLNGCSLKTAANLETVRALPSDRILIETDCPWCEIRPSHAGYSLIDPTRRQPKNVVKKEKWMPDKMVKSRNEPANIVQVLDVIAAVRNDDPTKLADIIYDNTIKLFFTQSQL